MAWGSLEDVTDELITKNEMGTFLGKMADETCL